uniref:Cleavage/polyadenylation specificity factor A subunit N-terminal domain-containing protein n=1 Tax=Anopheles maculatus TaxID=74869 RepID=A0A182SYL6_9DIPT
MLSLQPNPDQLHPLRMLQRNKSVARARSNAVSLRSTLEQDSSSFGGLVTLNGGDTVKLHCSPDQYSLIVELRRLRTNRTSEQRLHDLPQATGCLQTIGAYALNQTTLLVLLRHKHSGVATTNTLYQYDVVRGHLTPVKIPSPGPTCQHARLLQPTHGEIMLATAGCFDSVVSSGLKIYQLSNDGMSPFGLRHFQTIDLVSAVSAMGSTADGNVLLIKDDTNLWHRYAYSSVQVGVMVCIKQIGFLPSKK